MCCRDSSVLAGEDVRSLTSLTGNCGAQAKPGPVIVDTKFPRLELGLAAEGTPAPSRQRAQSKRKRVPTAAAASAGLLSDWGAAGKEVAQPSLMHMK